MMARWNRSPNQKSSMHASRDVYTEFPLKVFRDHVYQIIRTKKYMHQLQEKGKGYLWKEYRDRGDPDDSSVEDDEAADRTLDRSSSGSSDSDLESLQESDGDTDEEESLASASSNDSNNTG